MNEKQMLTLGILLVLFVAILVLVNLLDNKSINGIKAKQIGDGQHGTARWATKHEIRRFFSSLPFEPKLWRQGKNLPKMEGTVVACRGNKNTTALVDTGDVHTLMIGAAGVGKTAYFLYPNIEFACASGMSFLSTDTKGDVARNYGTIASKYYGYQVSVLDLRNPTRSDEHNILHMVNKYMDEYLSDKTNISAKAKAEKYAKITAKTIINIGGGDGNYGQNAFFYDAAEGLLSSVILLLAEFGEKSERHIVTVFKLIQDLIAKKPASNPKEKTQMYFHELMEKLPSEHKAKWLAETRKYRVAAYCRVSSSSEDQLNSYQAQLTYYSHKFEDSETEELVDLYADEGITGTREDKRDEFQRMMKDCRRGKIDRIYTKSISRFARNTRDCLKNIRELKSLGITILFEKENIDTANMTDEIMITIMGGLAQEESVSISQNMKWSYHKQMEKGEVSIHSAPYGYRLENGTLVINPEEAEVVKRIFSLFLCGYGYMAICQELNQFVCAKKEGGYIWMVAAIQYILSNERYIGDSLWQKSYNIELPFKKVRNKGEKSQYYIHNTHQAIISHEDFEKAQKLIAERRKPRCSEIIEYPLRKRIICKECNSIFKRQSRNGIAYWGCRTHYINAESCSVGRIAEKSIYAEFIRMHNKLLLHYRTILLPIQQMLLELKSKKYGNSTHVMNIHKEIAKLREQSHVIARLRTKGFMDEGKYQEQTAELNTKIRKLQAEIKKMTRSDDEDETLEQLDMLIDYFEKREQMMVSFEPETFENLVDKIVANKNELTFHLVGGICLKEACKSH